uniref:Uncharacterized protein n=1 Tax=Amphimedon queenslandica TaxID=400682 RepID=A0A1X7SNY5_AMPQE
LYVNYDCSTYCTNVCERLSKLLAKVCQSSAVIKLSQLPCTIVRGILLNIITASIPQLLSHDIINQHN